MIYDLGEQSLPIQEQRSPGGYIHPIEKGDMAEFSIHRLTNSVMFSEKFIASMGTVAIYLLRDLSPSAPNVIWRPGFYLSSNGIGEISRDDAQDKGLYELLIIVKNPVAKFREGQFFVHLSLDGQTDIVTGEFLNESQHHEKYNHRKLENGTDLINQSWRPNGESDFHLSALYIPYSPDDRKFLEDLYFRFSVVYPPEQGGAN